MSKEGKGSAFIVRLPIHEERENGELGRGRGTSRELVSGLCRSSLS
ncbi:hypothetical protein AKJ09_06045 [Labilithrix luteola]|uniref:Uncharacterized protein n=1 Tax=Labilithrix luteola TaxID=1391654 RepID=A0A0K1Q175_9BACT|nr:hypothetical protein [Labilithrix luteola]AKU99381.1 hypothetical protein AKJ09_06045 [Labilithrix luteola]